MLNDVGKEYSQLPTNIWEACKLYSTSISISLQGKRLRFVQAMARAFRKIILENFQKCMFGGAVSFCKLCSLFKTGGFLLAAAKPAEHKQK